MPPQLTEVWGATYLHIMIILLVFALGIPGLVFQMIVPDDIRHVAHRQAKITRWYGTWYILMIANVLACLSFVWVLHPNGICVPVWKSYAASGIVTLMVVSVVLFWSAHLGGRGRKSTISRLEKDLAKVFRKRGLVQERTLADLVYLGEHGKPGYEKSLVLEAIDRLAGELQSSARYSGIELGDFIRGLVVILANKEQTGSDDNFYLGGNILKRILNRLNANQLSVSYDAGLALVKLTEIGTAAIETMSEATASLFLEGVEYDSEIALKIGVSALYSKRFSIATAALNKLEALAEQQTSPSDKINASIIGLISHFGVAGKSSRKRADSFLSQMSSAGFSVKDCMDRAMNYHYSMGNFVTADKVSVMLQRVGNRIRGRNNRFFHKVQKKRLNVGGL